MLNTWNEGLKDSLDDPMVKKNISLLDKKDSDLLQGFKEGKVSLERSNALSIRNAIMKLYHGLEKIELSPENLKDAFNKPLTPDEAVDAFKKYVDEISRGKERDKIIIILK